MNRLESILNQRATRGRASVLGKMLFLCFGLALVLLTMALPPMPAEAAAQLARHCPPEPSTARPRVQATGEDANGGDLAPGDEIVWTFTVKNIGGTALTEIVLTDIVPEGTSYVDGSIEGPGAEDSGYPTLKWAVGTLEYGEKVTVSFRSRVDDGVPGGTLITNQASADSAQTPPGVSKAVTLEVVGLSAVDSAALSPSSSPTTVLAEATDAGASAEAPGGSAEIPGASEEVAEAAPGSAPTTTPPSSSETTLERTADDDPGSVAATASDDGKGWKLGVGLGVGLGGLALIGGTAGLLAWRRKRTPGA
jgi:uncharacterized repeat protein (TIGR01451 family)